MRTARPLLPLLAFLTACGATGSPPPASGTGGGGATTTTTSTTLTTTNAGPAVTGSVIDHYYGEGAPVDAPVDLSKGPVNAYVQENGAWQTYPGSGTAQGTFTIPGVPEGVFMVGAAGRYVLGSARSLDLGTDVQGRPGAAQAGKGTTIGAQVHGSGLEDEAAFELVNVNGGGAAYDFTTSGPANGTLDLTGSWSGALVDGSKGDTLYAVELVDAVTAGGAGYLNIGASVAFKGVEQQSGAQTTVSGTLADVSDNLSITLDLDPSLFDVPAQDVNAFAVSVYGTLDVFTLPGVSVGAVSNTVDLMTIPMAGSGMVGPMSYGNPFPSTWSTSLYITQVYSMHSDPLNGDFYGRVYVRMPVAAAMTGTIAAVVTPVQSLTINGQSASMDLTTTGATPTIAWMPPATGPATGYQIVAYEDSPDNQIAEIATTATSVTLPPNVLQEGHVYAFVVSAISSPANTPAAPFRGSTTYAGADAITSSLQP